jgi:hypothetical protein
MENDTHLGTRNKYLNPNIFKILKILAVLKEWLRENGHYLILALWHLEAAKTSEVERKLKD